MRKLLLSLFAVLTASTMFGQKVTLDFTNPVDDWKLPVKAEAVTEATQFSNGEYTITLAASTAAYAGGSESNGYTYLMIGKQGSSLTLPAFDFAVGKIVVTGNTGASKATVMNVYVGENEASTATTGSAETNTYEIAETYQAAGNVYALTITSNHNAQITKIEIYESGDEPTPASEDFEAALTDNQGNWTFEDVVLPEGLSYVWVQSSSYGMKASGYANSTKYVTDSYLVSPAIILGEGSVLTFEHVSRYGAEDIASQLSLWIREKGATDWAAQLTIPTYSDGSNWNYVASGDIDLSAYSGKTIQLGWRYTSDENYAATWELKNVKVTNAKAAEEAPELKDPTNTAETAYTVAEAIQIIKDRKDYDMTKYVYVKGIVASISSITPGSTGTYYIKDNLSDEDQIQVYKGNYLENHAFDTAEDIKEGDEVIVYGPITLYGSTYEFNTGNYIYSLNGETSYEQKELNDISNTPETAYTVAQAIALINDAQNDLTKEVYTKGVITSIKSLDVENYKRAQYYIGDTQDATETIQVYNGYFLEGHDFVANDQIKVGDEVVVYGKLTKFKDTYEVDANNYIYSLNGETTDGIRSISTDSQNGIIYDLSGRRVEKAVKGIYIVNGKKFVIK